MLNGVELGTAVRARATASTLAYTAIHRYYDQIFVATHSRIFAEHDKGTEKPSDDTLTKCLIEMVSLLIQSLYLQYLIVDALHINGCSNNSSMPAPKEDILDIVNTLEPLASLWVSLHNQSRQMKDIVD